MTSSSAITATFCATLVDEWIRCGVEHAVVAPGSRSTPMALAIAARSELQLHVFHDERSASFAALGIGLSSKSGKLMPAILLCTSGTAAVEFHAAVVEAHYASVPMLVCTADRPPELQGVGAAQTIDQQNLYGASTRLFVDAGIADDTGRDNWRQLAQEVLSAAVQTDAGPVHLNLPFREPLVGVAEELPADIGSRVKNLIDDPQTIPQALIQKLSAICVEEKGVIVAGNGIDNPQMVLDLAHRLQWPVFADSRSGCRVDVGDAHGAIVVSNADILLRDSETAAACSPQVVLRFGEPPVSKVVNAWLRESKCTYVAVSETLQLIDPDRIVVEHVVAKASHLCESLNVLVQKKPATPWVTNWAKMQATCSLILGSMCNDSSALTEPLVARALVEAMPQDSNLVLSSSMPVRDVEWFSAPRVGVRVLANRGVNGIDGVVSTAVGVAAESGKFTALLIGDIALLHDTNGLLNLMQRAVDLKIVVVDNKGGGIFSFLAQAATLDPQRFEQLFGTPHNVDIGQLVQAHGLPTTTVGTVAQLKGAIAQKGSCVIIINTARQQNVVDHDAVYAAVAKALKVE
ncbi:MAG: 2-succinyl-5-enolpyruvyl-6-hydroxy-3-cyclohexene-1-carboxylic-acid synthase [Actinobacteria bacterium]|nr:2-succinyl-5-enolpyruvyl-6-hydroxy-3-cyclohexene-1-carboxylic-acid synthase [Actinomycetota bacterium]